MRNRMYMYIFKLVLTVTVTKYSYISWNIYMHIMFSEQLHDRDVTILT